VKWLVKRGISVEVESGPERIFKDKEYLNAGARVLEKIRGAALLLGVKEPRARDLYQDKIYMIFSHTIKGQPQNMPLLKECIKRGITLIDYEKITDSHERRLVYFGRFAGICGLIDSLHYLGKKLEWKGIRNPFTLIQPAYKYGSLRRAKEAMAALDSEIRRRGFDKRLSPFIIGITGHGHVSEGVQKILEPLNPIEIHPRDMQGFIKHQKPIHKKLYKIVFLREEKLRSKDKKGFYFEEYLKNPKRFESNLDCYLPHINLLIHTSYWDSRYPRMVTKEIINRLYKKRHLRLEFIGDISCDINGSIELTHRLATRGEPTFTYNPGEKSFIDGYKAEGITVLAVDNLPSELPADASRDFSALLREYVYQIAAHGVRDITRHVAIPAEIRRAVVVQNVRLTKDFRYLVKCVR
jgi:alpha-aminoadipic semialdehyde synthase